MIRLTVCALGLGICSVGWAWAQDDGLPEPPRSPKQKAAGTAPADKSTDKPADKSSAKEPSPADKSAAPQGADASPSDGDRASRIRERLGDILGGGSGRVPPLRIRVQAPFVNLDLDLSGKARAAAPTSPGGAPAESVAPPRSVGGAAGPAAKDNGGAGDDQRWRYRWHEGRWWYWLSGGRWVYWESGRWNELSPAAERGAALELGTPRRGKVELEFDGVPPVRFGF